MQSATTIRSRVAELFRPPTRQTVAEAAAESVYLALPGGYRGPWAPEITPYMVEPMNCLADRRYDAVIFMGPAQSGKTEALILGWMGYIITCSPADTLIVEKSFDLARDFSRRRLDRLFRHSPRLKEKISARRHDDNVLDKWFTSGMVIAMGWPAINQLSGRPIKYVALTDYDRMPSDVDGEGDPFSLARKRTTTFMSGGMTLVESSPGNESLTPEGKPAVNWRPTTPHEAPPSAGITSLYNRGDRRRWYWRCPACENEFKPSFSALSYPDEGTPAQRARKTVIACPQCGVIISHQEKRSLNAIGRWVPEWETMGTEPQQTKIASFWLEGPAATFQSWESLVFRYLQAEAEYEKTGNEIPLKATVTLDQGRPYLSRRITAAQDGDDLLPRMEPDLERGVVPAGVRFLLAAVDVQMHRFVVQVVGVGVGRELWLIDRFDLALSERKDGDEPLAVEPAVYDQDWNLLIPRVLEAAYPLADGSGRKLAIRMVGCDSGGQPGVTERAYVFWRRLRSQGKQRNFHLVKGDGRSSSQRIRIVYPDSVQRPGRTATAKGDIPVMLLDSTAVKDAVHADLRVATPGPGYLHIPSWAGISFLDELTAETRGSKGWEKVNARNEAWDLLCYARAILIYLRVDTWGQNWERAPGWARGGDENPLILTGGKAPTQQATPTQNTTGRNESRIDRPVIPEKRTPWIRQNSPSSPWLK